MEFVLRLPELKQTVQANHSTIGQLSSSNITNNPIRGPIFSMLPPPRCMLCYAVLLSHLHPTHNGYIIPCPLCRNPPAKRRVHCYARWLVLARNTKPNPKPEKRTQQNQSQKAKSKAGATKAKKTSAIQHLNSGIHMHARQKKEKSSPNSRPVLSSPPRMSPPIPVLRGKEQEERKQTRGRALRHCGVREGA